MGTKTELCIVGGIGLITSLWGDIALRSGGSKIEEVVFADDSFPYTLRFLCEGWDKVFPCQRPENITQVGIESQDLKTPVPYAETMDCIGQDLSCFSRDPSIESKIWELYKQ